MKLPKISYCGINFNHIQWHRHLNKCNICREQYDKDNIIEKDKIKNWDKKCECGCGKITKYKNSYIIGHSFKNKKQSLEHKNKRFDSWFKNGNSELMSERLKNNNPCYSDKCVKRMLHDNPAKKDSVKKKISDNNSMKNQKYRDKIKETKKNKIW